VLPGRRRQGRGAADGPAGVVPLRRGRGGPSGGAAVSEERAVTGGGAAAGEGRAGEGRGRADRRQALRLGEGGKLDANAGVLAAVHDGEGVPAGRPAASPGDDVRVRRKGGLQRDARGGGAAG